VLKRIHMLKHIAVCLVILHERHGVPPDIQRKVVFVVLVPFETLGKSFDIDKGFQIRVFSEKPQACIVITKTFLIKSMKYSCVI